MMSNTATQGLAPPPGLVSATLLLFRWKLLDLRSGLTFTLAIQTLTAVGVVFGFGYLIPDVTPEVAFFIVTGAASLNVLQVGLVGVPQEIAYEQNTGSFAYMLVFPVSRLANLLAQLGVRLAEATPGVILALVVGSLHYDFELVFTLWLVPVFAAVTITGVCLGYVIAVLSPSPYLTNMLTQAFVFGLFLFSPVLYPRERLPTSLDFVHAILPVSYMAETVRNTLSGEPTAARTWLVLAGWALASLLIAWAVIARRPWTAIKER